MKYIRTKNWIFENNKNILIDEEESRIFIPGVPCEVLDIVKQADTIEELCDFVDIQYQDGSWETYPYEEEFRIKLLFYKAKKIFYGIRTDKGLIYVAKTNEKGELELL